MTLTLIASPQLAAAIRSGSNSSVRAAVAAARATLHPPPIDDPASQLSRTFHIEVSGRSAEALARKLSTLPGVEACYAKPADEPP